MIKGTTAVDLLLNYESDNSSVGDWPYNEIRNSSMISNARESARKQIEVLHGDNKALTQLFQKVAGEDTPRMYRFYKGYKLSEQLETKWLSNDVYISLNTFKTVERKSEHVVRLNALYTDLDFYKIGMDKGEVLARIDEIVANEEAPTPNMIIHSGRGLQLVWLIEYMAATPGYIRLWNRMQEAIYDTFKPLNADSSAKSITQLFRLAGTRNSKNGVTVTVEYLKESRYSITELKESLLEELPQDWKQQRAERLEKYKHQRKEKSQQAKKQGLTKRSLNKARMSDIEQLVDIRSGYINRRRAMFYYTVFAMEVLGDMSEVEVKAETLNNSFHKPLPPSVLSGSVYSAIRSYEIARDPLAKEHARANGWQAGYTFTNGYIIDNLDITLNEQQYMLTIIGEEEKKARKREANREMRRKQGMKTAKEYKDKRTQQKQERLEQLRKILDDKPETTRKELAEALGVSVDYIKRLKRELRKPQYRE